MNGFNFPAIRSRKRFALLALLGLAGLASPVAAEDILVTTAADSGAGSLRSALAAAADGDRIVFNIPGTPTIQLLTDLPDVAASVSFANNNAIPVTIDRAGNGPLTFVGSQVDPTILVINSFGAPSPNADIVSATTTTVYGNGSVTANLAIPGTLSPGSSAAAGNIGTFSVTGDADLTGGRLQVDLSASTPTPSSDLVEVSGTATVTNATLVPRFTGSAFEAGQQFLVLDSANPLIGTFVNQGETFQLPNNPFLQAIEDASLTANQFGFLIEDNGLPFADVVSGCNQASAANLLDNLFNSAVPPTAVLDLRNGSTEDVFTAVNQLSGSIYPSLINAEINHVQTGIESVRNMMVRQAVCNCVGFRPWIRGYGIAAEVDTDDCQTLGYRQEVGGIEMGCGIGTGLGVSGTIFSQMGFGDLDIRGVDQSADTNSYRLGGSLGYVHRHVYFLAAGGAGVQTYDVRRSLSAFEGSSFAESSFDGSSQFGYLEVAYTDPITPYVAMHLTRVDLDPITETGDDEYTLINNGGAGNSLRSILGVACYQSDCTAFGVATTRLRFGWLHEYLDESETFVSQIAIGGPDDLIIDRGVSAGRDWGFARLQVDMGMVMGGYLTIGYEGHYNSDSAFNWLLVGWMY